MQNNSIPRYEVWELEIRSERAYANPFTDVSVTTTFCAPSGTRLTAWGCYDGDDTWRVRLAPEELGEWSYETSCSDPRNAGLHAQRGTFRCVPSESHGFIRPNPVHKHHFAFSDGTPWFGLGDTCFGLAANIPDARRLEYLDTRARQGFNYLSFHVSGFPFGADSQEPVFPLPGPDCWPWGGSQEEPDFDRLNVRYFRRLEGILADLKARGMYAWLILCNYYSRPFPHNAQSSQWSKAREELWVRYAVSRLAAFTTVWQWTVTTEFECYPDGPYVYTPPLEVDWLFEVCDLIHRTDPQRRPVCGTVAAKIEHTDDIAGSPQLDYIALMDYGAAEWNGRYMDGSAEGIEQSIWKYRAYGKPVINDEFGFEWLPGYQPDKQCFYSGTDRLRRAAWRSFVAGAAACKAGFAGTWLARDTIWSGNMPAPFIVTDNGLAAQLGHLRRFISERTRFWRMAPCQEAVEPPNLCLAEPGREYVVFAPLGGLVRLHLGAAPGPWAFEWLNPRSGEYLVGETALAADGLQLLAPDANDWVLHLSWEVLPWRRP